LLEPPLSAHENFPDAMRNLQAGSKNVENNFLDKLKKITTGKQQKPEQTVRPPKLITLDEFSALKLDQRLIKDGLVFIWIEKKINHYITIFMEAQGFEYVENF
jgi:hypothetical protein